MADGGVLSFSQAKALILKQNLSAAEVQILQNAPQTVFAEFDKEVFSFYFVQFSCHCYYHHFFVLFLIFHQFLFEGEEDHNLLFHSVKSGNKQAFEIVLKRSDVNWQNGKGTELERRAIIYIL